MLYRETVNGCTCIYMYMRLNQFLSLFTCTCTCRYDYLQFTDSTGEKKTFDDTYGSDHWPSVSVQYILINIVSFLYIEL